jgi:hypothetical protein
VPRRPTHPNPPPAPPPLTPPRRPQSFSSVVGPNGSGKSNVIDAMLFVFGKRAKQLRLSKVSELIHNSTHHQGLEMAKVSVHFQEIVDGVRLFAGWRGAAADDDDDDDDDADADAAAADAAAAAAELLR